MFGGGVPLSMVQPQFQGHDQKKGKDGPNFPAGGMNIGNISNIARDQDASYLHINNTNISI